MTTCADAQRRAYARRQWAVVFDLFLTLLAQRTHEETA